MSADASLVLHVGARRVDRSELDAIPCPPPEGRWRPVPHSTVLTYAEKALTDAGYGVEKMDLGLSRDNHKFFGTMTLRAPLSGVGNTPVANLAVGIRSSTDRSISLQWCCGSRVFVCDNLSFSSELVIARKHTTHGVDRYQEAIARRVAELNDYRDFEAFRIREMQRRDVSDELAESILLRAFETGILGARALPVAIDEWRKPSWPEFAEGGKTAWRLYNAITFALGRRAQSNPQAHARATIRLGVLVLPQTDAVPVPTSPPAPAAQVSGA